MKNWKDNPMHTPTGRAITLAVLLSAVLWFAYYSAHPQRAWFFTVALLACFCILLGLWLMKLPLGIFLSNRNLMSLSRLQLVVWTVVIFSGYLVVLMQRILHHVYHPLDINIDSNLWAALGISLASFVATPIVLNGKMQNNPSAQSVQAAGIALQEAPQAIQQNAQGTLYVNPSPADASVSDMFQGDEIGNTAYVDISKVQMFLLTIFIVAAYCNDLGHFLAGFDASLRGVDFTNLNGLPPFSTSEVQLLGVSHAGYLTFKAVGHTQS
jgi:hypothetical protein